MDEIYQNKLTNISIHAPREGGDLDAQLVARVDVVFQSTPPARGATPYNSVTYAGMRHFNPRPPRGGRHYERHSQRHYPDFNPRPPRGGRPKGTDFSKISKKFQSTPPARGATVSGFAAHHRYPNFNPRPPRGGRQLPDQDLKICVTISIHAPREGGDGAVWLHCRDAF